MTISAVSIKSERDRNIAWLAAQAMHREVKLTPKPGLVDSENNGAHRDMTIMHFMVSLRAISPWFPRFYDQGFATAGLPARQTLLAIRPTGLACEQAMFKATGGINTHKGGIFSLGLLCAAAGRLAKDNVRLSQETLCQEVRAMCAGLVDRELSRNDRVKTRGEEFFQAFGFTGARGEAERGFETVRRYGLPQWNKTLREGGTEEEALLKMLLALMAANSDTNLISRGGIAGLEYVRRYATRLMKIKDLSGERLRTALKNMDHAFIKKNLSPGGSADLLAVGWLLSHYPAS